MRKKTVTHVADTIFWYMLYFLPIIICILSALAYSGTQLPTDGNVIYYYNLDNILGAFGFYGDSIIGNVIYDIFGEEGILPFFTNSVSGNYPICAYFEYFVCVYLVHLCVDFILFIPRIAHKWLNKFTRECE